jgi:cytochrome P450
LYELGTNLDIQDDLYEEIRKYVNPEEPVISEDKIEKMVLLKATLSEVYRLYAVASLIGRQLQQDVVLNGYQVPKGVS